MKILMVLTSHDKLGDTGRKTGFWLEEFAAPYFTFLDAGATVTVEAEQRVLLFSSDSITAPPESALAQTKYVPGGVVRGMARLLVAELDAPAARDTTPRVVLITTSSPSP